MAFVSRMTKSLFGRDLGLEHLSSVDSGSTHDEDRIWLVGNVAGIRKDVTTAETTSVPLKAHGLSILSTKSSGVHTLNPPIPGVRKVIASSGSTFAWVITRNGETIESSRGSTFTTMKFTTRGVIELIGYTTARWLALAISSGSSSQAASILLSTST